MVIIMVNDIKEFLDSWGFETKVLKNGNISAIGDYDLWRKLMSYGHGDEKDDPDTISTNNAFNLSDDDIEANINDIDCSIYTYRVKGRLKVVAPAVSWQKFIEVCLS